MKKVAVVLCALVLGACTKDYKCTIVTEYTYAGYTLDSEVSVSFRGTKEEMKKYESDNTKDLPDLKQTTTCKK